MSNSKNSRGENQHYEGRDAQHEHFDALLNQYESKHLSRRQLLSALVASAAGGLMAHAEAQAPAAIGRSMNHVSLSVSDVKRSADFYSRVLGMEIVSRPANGGLNLGLGSESFLGLYELGDPGRMHHLCIGVDNYNPDRLAERLSDHGIYASVNRDLTNRTSGGDQLYFTDPDDILVQLAQHGYLG
ncbi:MAG TPA: hypothetical protein DEF79_13310 [Gammaproteobacteria bacterium]|nr:hypothetical protein [Gammaproteobacteria bacterium]|tara:strand:- start:2911 stop:3468 length:558 start_codon:yes stop_codon:yes gene_type:complete